MLLHDVIEPVEVGEAGDVALHADRAMADRLHRRVEFFLTAAGDEHLGALFGQFLRDAEADTAVAAGHDSHLVFEIISHGHSPVPGRRTVRHPMCRR